jgi:Domain of unknown function (DUF4249)
MKPARFFIVLVLLVQACIDPFIIKLSSSESVLVVDGMITDQPGPYTVKLSQTLPVNEQLGQITAVTSAIVTIYDDQGTTEVLKVATPGLYQTSTIQGEVGRTYHIRIEIGNKVYESIPEKLLPVGNISKVYQEFELNDRVKVQNPLSSPNGFNLFLDATILPEQSGLVRWRWTGTFEIKAFPELETKIVLVGPNPVPFPNPPACSGYIVNPADKTRKTTIQLYPCSCCNCWVTQYNAFPLISDPQFVDGDIVSKFSLGFIPATRRIFYDKFYLEVEQMSTSQVVYDFWKKVGQQKNTGTNLFQTPPPKTVGNIIAKSENTADAIGVFAASAIKKQQLVILRSDIPYQLQPIDTIAMSCQRAYKNSQSEKPAFW